MSTDNLVTDLETILAAKRQFLTERRAKTPIAAVIALADMQRRPHPILNTVTNGSQVTLIGQITHSDTYDPVSATLGYIREGMDAVSLFTDQTIYRRGLDDLMLVARGVNIPVISQDYILDEYHVVEARAAGASALVLCASVLDHATLRQVVTATQRWRMTAIVQVENEDELLYAQSLSPHVIAFGTTSPMSGSDSIEAMRSLRQKIDYNIRCMILNCLETLEEVKAAVDLGVDAVVVSEKIFNARGASGHLKALMIRDDSQ